MESQDSLIESIAHADEDEDDSRNDTEQSVVVPAKSRFLILEPAVLLLFFAWSITGKKFDIVLHDYFVNYFVLSNSGTVFQNQIIFQTCTDVFKFNETECVLLGTQNGTNVTEAIEKLVQPYAARFFMARTIVESLLPALVSLFIGPWSDKFGRKPLIVSTLIGKCFPSMI